MGWIIALVVFGCLWTLLVGTALCGLAFITGRETLARFAIAAASYVVLIMFFIIGEIFFG